MAFKIENRAADFWSPERMAKRSSGQTHRRIREKIERDIVRIAHEAIIAWALVSAEHYGLVNFVFEGD